MVCEISFLNNFVIRSETEIDIEVNFVQNTETKLGLVKSNNKRLHYKTKLVLIKKKQQNKKIDIKQ